MDEELALIGRLAHTGQVERVIASGVEERHFADPECRAVWTTAVAHVRRYKAAPSLSVLRKSHPKFSFMLIPDAMEYVLDQFVNRVNERFAQEALLELGEAVGKQDDKSLLSEMFLEKAREFSRLVPSPLVARYSDLDKLVEEIRDEHESGEEATGIPTGLQGVDGMTNGVQLHEMVCYVAWQGTGKSSALIVGLMAAYIAGYTPMFVSLEMGEKVIRKRLAAIATQIRYSAIRARELGQDDFEALDAAAKRAREASNDILIMDEVGMAVTTEKVYSYVDRYRPDLVAVDYVQMLRAPQRRDQKRHEVLADVAYDLKSIARGMNVPVYVAAQSNRDSAKIDGPTLDNIGESSAIGAAADIVVGFHRPDRLKREKAMEVRLLKSRDSGEGTFKMVWDHESSVYRAWRKQDDWAGKLRGTD